MNEYNQNRKSLIDNRMDNIVSDRSNSKLALLLQSGLLNKNQNIQEIIDRSLEKYQEEKMIEGI